MSVSGSTFDSDLANMWPLTSLKRDLKCSICNSEDQNHWYVCVRKHALVNLHHGFVSRPRQLWLMAIAISKFLVVPHNYEGEFFHFQGPITCPVPAVPLNNWHVPRTPKNNGVRILQDAPSERIHPRMLNKSKVVAYGKFL